MILDGQVQGRPLISYKDTKTAIEALTGVVAGMTAYATDTGLTGYYTGTSWVWGIGSSGSIILALPQYHFFVGGSSGSAEDAGTGITYNPSTNRLSLDNVQWDLTPTPVAPSEGLMYWNSDDGTLNLGMPGGDVNLQLGQEMLLRAKNETGSPITNGQLVYISGGTGSNAIVSLAQANAELSSAATIGMATETIADNQFGYITLSGMVRDINTSGSAAGTVLYLSPTVAGAYTGNKPVAPNHLVSIGVIIRSHATEGVVFVRVDNGFEISELHDVYINSVSDGQILQYINSNSRWENKSVLGDASLSSSGSLVLATVNSNVGSFTNASITVNAKGLITAASSGSTPITGSGTTNYVAKFTGTNTVGNSLIQDDGTTVGIGTAPISSALLDIRPTSTLTSGTFNGQTVTLTANPGGSSSGVFQGLSFAAATQSGNAQNFTGSVRGIVGQAQHNGTGTVTALTGFDVQTQINSSGNVTTVKGIKVDGLVGSTGRATNNYGIEIGTNIAVTNVNTALLILASSAACSLKYGISIGAISGGSSANVAIETLGGQLQFTHNANSTLATFTGNSTFTAATPLMLLTRNDANTNVVVTSLTLRANTTGVADVGFGSKLAWQLESSTTASQTAGAVDVLWNVATHASAVSDMVLSAAYNSGAAIVASEFLRGRGNAGIIVTGSQTGTYTTTAVDLTLTAAHHWVRVTAAKTITLPTAVGISGREYIITATVNNVIVDAATTELINGSLTQVLLSGDSIQIKSDGAGWKII